MAWAAIATLVFARWLLLRSRTIAAALRSPSTPSHRELEMLGQARRILAIRTAVDLIRSPLAEAPAVLRVVRPVILLPTRGCEELTDDELRALLLHELAHVARRDNFVSMLLAAAAALLWFHPLVWLALRQLDAAREQACDEVAMEHAGSYIDALIKVCRAAIAPRSAGAACMAGGNLKGRMEHLMRYERLREGAWPHRGVVAVAMIAIIAATAFAATPLKQEELYSLRYKVTPDESTAMLEIFVVDNPTEAVIARAKVTARHGEWATMTSEHNGRTLDVRARMTEKRAELTLVVTTPTETLQRTRYTWQPMPITPANGAYSGDPISINLKDAQLSDVMKTFGQITGLAIELAPGVEGRVTVNVTDVPWDQVLEMIAKQNGLKMTIDGKTIHLTK